MDTLKQTISSSNQNNTVWCLKLNTLFMWSENQTLFKEITNSKFVYISYFNSYKMLKQYKYL